MASSPLQKTISRIRWLNSRLDTVSRHAACAALTVAVAVFAGAGPAAACDGWHAEIRAVEGKVDVQRRGANEWSAITMSDALCRGDKIRTGEYGRVTIALPDGTALRLKPDSESALEEPEGGLGTLVRIIRGIMHVISRDPRELTFTTPYANAGLEGTEFDIGVAEDGAETVVTVLEGEVVVTNPNGRVYAPARTRATATGAAAPAVDRVAAPIESMRWASYYPPLFAADLPKPDAAPSAADSSSAQFLNARAASRLRFGRVAEAEMDLLEAERLASANATSPALRSMIARAHGDKAAALALAEKARALDSRSAIPLLAVSYAQQSAGDIAAAARATAAAVELEPGNALAWARHAELALAQRDVETSIAYALHSVELDPTLAAPHTVLGFAYRHLFDAPRSIEAFAKGAELDQAAPLPRLGLALALAQGGDVKAARRELEMAVAQSPDDPIFRSYMAILYGQDQREDLTASQLELAKELDALDPTAWRYDAERLLSENRPIEAVKSFRRAAERNDDLAVFRSSLLIEPDLAIRGSGDAGRSHRDAGVPQLALLQGYEVVARRPTDHTGHQLLSDVLSLTPRAETARISELHVAELLQPATLVPIQPQLAQPAAFLTGTLGPSDLALSELAPPITQDGIRVRSSVVASGNGTRGADIAMAGLSGSVSYGFGHFDYQTDGFRPNNDFDQTITNAFVQLHPGSQTSVRLEARAVDIESGDLSLFFNPERYSPSVRVAHATDSVRAGVRHDFGARNTLLASVLRQESTASTTVTGFELRGVDTGYHVDVQDIHEWDRWRLQAGVSHSRRENVTSTLLPFPPFASRSEDEPTHTSAYVYAHIDAAPSLLLTAGVSADDVDDAEVDVDALSPKLGLMWRATSRLTLRAAAFDRVERSSTLFRQAPQPQLEPVQIAGFNQLLLSSRGEETSTAGIGLDAAISERAFAGVEVQRRNIDGAIKHATSPAGGSAAQNHGNEASQQAYFYWLPTDQLSLSARYQHDRFSNEQEALLGFTDMTLRRLPLELRYFAPNGVSTGVRATRVRQHGTFLVPSTGSFDVVSPGSDDFWVVDVSLGYRFANRRGLLSFNVDNLLDKSFRFQDIDPESPSIMPERMSYLRFTWAFD